MQIRTLDSWLRETYGRKVYKLALSTGCTCPNRDGTLGTRGCIFCDGAGAFAAAGPIDDQLRAARALVAKKAGPGAGYVAYFQSFTNTYGDPARLRPLFEAAMAPEDVVALSVATRPDCLGEDILSLLAELSRAKPVWVELGLQTVREDTAAWLRRGYPLSVYDDAVRRLRKAGLTVVTHMILGLPGETAADMAATARHIGELGSDGVKFHLLHVLRGTDLEEEWRAGRVKTMTLDAYIFALEGCLAVTPPEVVIHRLTGDGDRRSLLAPRWSADRQYVLQEIHAALTRDGVVQGSAL